VRSAPQARNGTEEETGDHDRGKKKKKKRSTLCVTQASKSQQQ
jgi:hypothetical protein